MVGQVAKRQAITNPDRTISSIKRDMGSNRKVTIDDKQYTPQEISAMILQKIKQDAESHLGETVSQAVITVPAYFNGAAAGDQAMRAGLRDWKCSRIINEPTAAGPAYGVDKGKRAENHGVRPRRRHLDVSILDIGDGVARSACHQRQQ